jgi:endosialidase-like protein
MRDLIIDGWPFYRLPDGSLLPELTGAKGDAPGPAQPTDEEKRLMRIQGTAAQEQLTIARSQQAENEALMPLLLQEYGLTRVVDPVTKQISYTKSPDDLTTKRKEIEGMQLDRSLKALKGELPVTATLTKELELGKRTLAEKLSRQLGPGWETSSAGIQAQAEYDRMATSLKEAEQKDQLTTAEALSINRQQSRAGNTEGTYNTMSTPNIGASGLLSNASGGAGSGLQYYGRLREASERAQQVAAQERGGYVSGVLGAAGLGAGLFMLSDPDLKTDVAPVDDGAMLLAVRKLPVKMWRYKADPEKRKHLGGMADKMPAIVSDGKQVDVISYLGMLTGSIRALDKKIESDEDWSPGLLLTA